MKITPIDNDMYSVVDQRGTFTVHGSKVIDLIDNDGVLHLPMTTPMDVIRIDKAVYDLDQTTGYPLEIYFEVNYSTQLGQIILNNNFKILPEFVGYLVYTHNNQFINYKIEYDLCNGVKLKDLLMAVVNKLYPPKTFGGEGFKLLKTEHFVGTKWRHLTVQDIMDIWNAYHSPLNYTDMVLNKDDYFMTPRSDHPLHKLVTPNYQLYSVKQNQQDVEFTIIVFDDVDQHLDMREAELMTILNNYVNRLPVDGVLYVGENEYEVGNYLTDQYVWNKEDFLNNFFGEHGGYNESVKQRIIQSVKLNGERE